MSVQVQAPLLVRETSRRATRDKMAARRRKYNASEKNLLASGLYVHSSPPRVLQMNPSVIRQWLRGGDVDRLEQVVLEGQGHKLVGEYSPDPKARAFLKTVPQYMAKIEMLHDAVARGQDTDVKSMLAEDPRRRLVLCKGQAGVGLLHKAIHFEHLDLARWMIDNHPATVTAKDREGRTSLHYCAASRQPTALWERLVAAGADDSAVDARGQPATFYLDHPEQISLPEPKKVMGGARRYTDGKDGLVVSRANIRICIHDRDLGRLQQMLWEGHGGKLRVETSNNPRVKRFLDAVPYIMGTIKEVHAAAVNGDVDMFTKRTAEPVPDQIMLSRDDNGLQPLHKAAGLGHRPIVDAILSRTPAALGGVDHEGKTPLHYAAVAKDPGIFEYLVDRGADEAAIDHKGKTPAQYRARPSELDASRMRVVPDAPRTASMFPPAWDWRLLNNMTYDFGPLKSHQSSGQSDHKQPVKKSVPRAAIPVPVPTKRPISRHEHRDDVEDHEDHEDPEEPEDHEHHEDRYEPDEEPAEEHREADILYLDVPRSEIDDKLRPGSLSDAGQDEDEGVDSEDDRQDDELRHVATDDEDPPPYQDEDGDQDRDQEQDQEQDQEHNEAHERPAMKFNDDVLEEIGEGGARSADPEADEGVGSDHDASAKESGPGDEAEFHNTVTGVADADNEVENPGLASVSGSQQQQNGDEVARLVAAGDMEALAAMVLAGKGRLLLGHDSEDPELHTFLTNVPAYTAKIHAVHKAAREGQLRDLQASLDRRKFAVARDEATPLGATPLHVATLFGNTGVVRYLATRFPETLNAKDQDGRTPLHYAAAIADNGHYFNMLVNLGANPTLKDKSGRTAEYYLRNQERMTHKSLLQQFGASQDAADALQDKVPDDVYSARRDVDDADLIATMDRCFELVRGETDSKHELKPQKPPQSLLRKHLKPVVFAKVKKYLTRADHNLLDVIWPGAKRLPVDRETAEATEIVDIVTENGGVIAPDYEAYWVFADFLMPLVKDLHGLGVRAELAVHPASAFEEPVEEDADDSDDGEPKTAKTRVEFAPKAVNGFRIECVRNLAAFQITSGLTLSQLEDLERQVKATFEDLVDSAQPGRYYDMEDVLKANSEVHEALTKAGLMIRLSDSNANFDVLLHGSHWPNGRGVFVFENNKMAAWVNVQEHVRVVGRADGNLDDVYALFATVMPRLDAVLEPKRDVGLGFLAARPSFLGNGMRLTAEVSLPKLGREDKLKSLCSVRGLSVAKSNVDNVFKLWSRQSLGVAEFKAFEEFKMAVANVVDLEKSTAASQNPTMNFTGIIGNIFKKK